MYAKNNTYMYNEETRVVNTLISKEIASKLKTIRRLSAAFFSFLN